MSRRRHADYNYSITTTTPGGSIIIKNNLDSFEDIANYINREFFSDFPVVSRAMVNNWVFYDKKRRAFGTGFNITRIPL